MSASRAGTRHSSSLARFLLAVGTLAAVAIAVALDCPMSVSLLAPLAAGLALLSVTPAAVAGADRGPPEAGEHRIGRRRGIAIHSFVNDLPLTDSAG
jgi:hypothetical protein